MGQNCRFNTYVSTSMGRVLLARIKLVAPTPSLHCCVNVNTRTAWHATLWSPPRAREGKDTQLSRKRWEQANWESTYVKIILKCILSKQCVRWQHPTCIRRYPIRFSISYRDWAVSGFPQPLQENVGIINVKVARPSVSIFDVLNVHYFHNTPNATNIYGWKNRAAQ